MIMRLTCTYTCVHCSLVPGGRSGRRSPQGPNSHPRQRCRSRCWTSVAEGRWPYACHARHAPPSHAHHRPPTALPPRPQPPRPAAAPQHRFAADATLSTTALLQPSSARRLNLLPPRATPPLASLPAPGGRCLSQESMAGKDRRRRSREEEAALTSSPCWRVSCRAGSPRCSCLPRPGRAPPSLPCELEGVVCNGSAASEGPGL